jgi:hypothetical protein
MRVTGMKGDPTPAQVRLAEQISKALGIDLPGERSKQAYSDYINRHMKKIKGDK